jgi:acylphosphatase
MAAVRFLVSGRVQGVAFRAHTRAEALGLGLSGHARNLADGRVEVLAVGDADAIERLAAWLRQGPPLARVDGLFREVVDGAVSPQGFAVC